MSFNEIKNKLKAQASSTRYKTDDKGIVREQPQNNGKPQNNKDIYMAAKFIEIEKVLFDLKIDIVTLHNMLLNKKFDKEKYERKDVETMYLEFKTQKQHLISKLNLINEYNTEA